MAPAASTTNAVHDPPPRRRRRRPHGSIPRRSLLQLLVGVLVVGVIPVVATVHILDANAVQNERARADSALRAERKEQVRSSARWRTMLRTEPTISPSP